jgi:hypothetical protein
VQQIRRCPFGDEELKNIRFRTNAKDILVAGSKTDITAALDRQGVRLQPALLSVWVARRTSAPPMMVAPQIQSAYDFSGF